VDAAHAEHEGARASRPFSRAVRKTRRDALTSQSPPDGPQPPGGPAILTTVEWHDGCDGAVAKEKAMRTTIAALLAAVTTTFIAASARAEAPAPETSQTHQAVQPKTMSLSIEPSTFVPIGSLSDSTGTQFGAMLGFEGRLSDSVTLVAHGGYLSGLSVTHTIDNISVNTSISAAPVIAGVRFYPGGQASHGLYLSGEAGGFVLASSLSMAASRLPAVDTSDTSVKLGSMLGVGGRDGIVDVRLGLATLDVSQPDKSTAFFVNVGLAFLRF
jgi:hypothetical protein